MAYTTINDPTIYFNTVLYTGNGTAIGSGGQAVTGVGFQPDWTWIKNRSDDQNHSLTDSVRGVTKTIRTDVTTAETTDSEGQTAFGSDGFTVGSEQKINGSGHNIVAWNWLAGGSASSNSDGATSSSVSANTTAGFSIVTYTGTGSTTTLGHGLGAVPKWIVVKNRGRVKDWCVYHVSLEETHKIELNLAVAASDDNAVWNDTAPTSSVFTVGPSDQRTNASSDTYVAYCFAEKKGYSKFGSYTGNGNADGPMLYTGFRPAWFLVKNTAASEHWRIYDNKRITFNHMFRLLNPNESSAESTVDNASEEIDFLSNGVKIRSSAAQLNGSGNTLIYMAFAESPFVNEDGVPNNAR